MPTIAIRSLSAIMVSLTTFYLSFGFELIGFFVRFSSGVVSLSSFLSLGFCLPKW